MTPTTIIDHSIVGSALGAWYYFRDRTGVESHFIVRGAPSGSEDGRIWQLMDMGRRADANLNANAFAISIETEDNGDPDHFPWSRAQLESLRWLHAKLRAVHPTIPRRRCRSTSGGGLGHHSMWGAPSPWTPVAGKTCPGRPVRVRQWEQILLPAFLREEFNDLGTFEGFSGRGRESFEAAVRDAVDRIMSLGLTGDPDGRIRAWAKQLDDLHGPLGNTADVDVRVREELRAGFGGCARMRPAPRCGRRRSGSSPRCSTSRASSTGCFRRLGRPTRRVRPRRDTTRYERAKGIEPSPRAWEAPSARLVRADPTARSAWA
jgi:N-acetylmuramoyl-L-alanine amidase